VWTEDGDSMFLQNVGIYPEVHMALLPRRPTLTVKQCPFECVPHINLIYVMLSLHFDILFQPYRFSNEELRVLRQCNRDSFYKRCIPLASVLGIGTYYGVKSGGFIQML
jgi:hypothetical protein